MISLRYRSDIDGLRAVAVLGVVIYHAFPWLIPGGFIGVDIFFVISGYLISGILYKGLKTNGGEENFSPFSFSFREFYARRIRRLFPALITMLVITMAYGWLILLPDEFEQLGKHVAAGTLFIQNIVFWQESGYFDTAASLKPLLHLWSLAVEEQFYIFFPLLLILLLRKPKILAPAMVVLLIATFILNVVMSAQNCASDFFLTPYRAWEFLGGSLLAWWHEERVKKLGGVARGQGILDGKAPASENPPAGFDRAGNTARRGPLSSPEGLGGFSSWPALDQAGQARCGDCHSPPSLAKLENPLQRNPSEFLHTLLDRGHEEDVTLYREALSWIGVILLGLGFGLIHTGDPYPGWRALLPVAGTLLLMEGGAGGLKGAWVNRKILSHPAVVWIGLISYPLYLFHWPALSFVHIVKGSEPKSVYLIDALIVALVLTVLTYYFIEKKLRHNRGRWTLPILVIAFILVGAVGASVWGGWIKPPSVKLHLEDMVMSGSEEFCPPSTKYLPAAPHLALFHVGGNGPQTLFVGDSNILQYTPRLRHLLTQGVDDSRGALILWGGGIPPVQGIFDPVHPGTREMIPEMEKLIREDKKIDRVVIGSNWVWWSCLPGFSYQIEGKAFPAEDAKVAALVSIRKMIHQLRDEGKAVYLVLNIPVDPIQDPKSEMMRRFDGVTISAVPPMTASAFCSLYGDFLFRLKNAGEKAGAIVIDPLDFFLASGVYPRIIHGKHIYKDSCHLRPSFVRDNVTYLDETIRE